MRIFVHRQEANTTCHNMGHQVAISELLSLDEKWRNAHLRIGSSVWKNPAKSRTTNEDAQKQPHKIPASCQFNLMNSSCSSSTSLPLDFCPQKIAFHGNLNRSNQFSQKLHAIVYHCVSGTFIGHRCQDAYLWLDWISIPQIVEDSETSDGDESREISGRLRRRSRGLRMSLRSFRGLDGDGGPGGGKVKKGRVTK
jgi:hypothetical protein